MRVIINGLQMLKQRTGIGHYTAELLRCLRAEAGPDQFDGFPGGLTRRVAAACFRAASRVGLGGSGRRPLGPEMVSFGSPLNQARGLLHGGLQRFLAGSFRRTCARGAYELYHEPNYLPMPADCPTVATVHDLSVVLHPQWHPAERVRRFERQLPQVLARCQHFLVDTDSVRQEAIRHLGIAPERVSRVYMGIRKDLRPLPKEVVSVQLARLGLPPRYLLYLGTIEPRKNVLQLLQAYCTLAARLRVECPLLIVGGWGWNTADVRRCLDDWACARGVIHLGYVDDSILPILYNGARALVFPSHYEGFGLPPLEMLACGGAVLASTASALQETMGTHLQLIDPDDVDGWRTALMRVISDDAWWLSLRKGGVELARPFTWERCAAQTRAVYRLVCGQANVRAPLAA